MQYANNEVGVVQNIPELAALCREADVLLHVDAVQAAGHLAIPLDGIDFLSASAHKFGGPKGIGFLYVREPRKLRPLIYGGSQQYGLRPGTEPAALIAGLAAAFKVTCAERRQRTAKKRALAEEFWQTLHAARPEARLHTPADGLPGLLSVGLPGRSGQRLTYQLDVAGVSVSPGAACDNRGVQEPSHVLMALGGTAAEDALSTLRFSFGSANRPGDGKEAAERLIKIADYFSVTTDYLLGRSSSNLPVDVFSTPLLDDMTSGEMIQLVQALSPDRKKALHLLLRDLHFSTVVGQYNHKEAK